MLSAASGARNSGASAATTAVTVTTATSPLATTMRGASDPGRLGESAASTAPRTPSYIRLSKQFAPKPSNRSDTVMVSGRSPVFSMVIS